MRQNRIPNELISGASLEGRILEVAGDKVRLHLDVDDAQQKEEACWFPYSSAYTAEGNSGFFFMPEIGDAVQLYFMEENENEAIALSSIRKSGQESPKMADPSVKYLGNPHGKEMMLGDKELNLTAKEGALFISVNEDDGITIQSDSTIMLNAKEDIEIEADKLDIKAEEGMYLISSESSIIMDGETDIRGEEVILEGLGKGPVHVEELEEEERALPQAPSEIPAFTAKVSPPKAADKNGSLDDIQLLLDVAGAVPALGIPSNLINAGISAGRGNWVDAGLSVVSCVPIIGPVAKFLSKGKGIGKGLLRLFKGKGKKAKGKKSDKKKQQQKNQQKEKKQKNQDKKEKEVSDPAANETSPGKGKMTTGSKKVKNQVQDQIEKVKEEIKSVLDNMQSNLGGRIATEFAFNSASSAGFDYISDKVGMNLSLFSLLGTKRGGKLKGNSVDSKTVKKGEDIIAERVKKAELNLTPKPTPYKSLNRGQQKKIKEKIENRTVTKEEYKRYQWDKRFSKRRAAGINNFWKQEKKRIIDKEPTTRNWTTEQMQDILKGKKPKHNGKAIIGHHTYNAMNYPHISNKGELIYPVTNKEHLKGWHGGSFRKNAPGSPVNPNYLEEF